MTIMIECLEFETILGLLEHERITPQRVMVDCIVDYRYEPGSFVDYAQAAALIESLMLEGRFELIEEALHTIASRLKQTFPSIETIDLSIRKLDILPSCTVGARNRFVF